MTNRLTAVLVTAIMTNWTTTHTLYPPDRLLPQDVQSAYITTNVYIRTEYITRNGSVILTVTEVEKIQERDTNSISALRREVTAQPQLFPHSWQLQIK